MDIYNLISGRRLPSDGEKEGPRPSPKDDKKDDVFLVDFEPGDGLNPRWSLRHVEQPSASLLTIRSWTVYRGVADRYQDHLVRAYSRDWILGYPRRLCVFADLHRRVGGLWSQHAEV